MYWSLLRSIRRTIERASFCAGLALKPSNRCKYAYARRLGAASRQDRASLEAAQLAKLTVLLCHANRHVPYYHDLFRSLGLVKTREEDVILENLGELKRFPILHKMTIHRVAAALHSNQASQRGAYSNTSGGSTGEKAVFCQDCVFGQTTSANFLFARILMGIPAWASSPVLLWAAVRDIGLPTIPASKTAALLRGSIVLNSCKMRPDDMRCILEIIDYKRPQFIRGYAQSLYELAKFARSQGIRIAPQKAVISTATTLSADMREVVESVFGCRVFDYYGSREVGPIATECRAHDGLHVLEDNNIVELLDDSGRDAQPGQVGDIVLTNLNNFSMPLIRYKVGDAAFAPRNSDACSCGCHYGKIGRLVGRTSDMFRLRNGDMVDGTYLTTLFNSVDSIERFQIVQHDYDLLELIIQAPAPIGDSLVRNIETQLRKSMGPECVIKWRYTPEIEAGPTGKYRYVISKIAGEREPTVGATMSGDLA